MQIYHLKRNQNLNGSFQCCIKGFENQHIYDSKKIKNLQFSILNCNIKCILWSHKFVLNELHKMWLMFYEVHLIQTWDTRNIFNMAMNIIMFTCLWIRLKNQVLYQDTLFQLISYITKKSNLKPSVDVSLIKMTCEKHYWRLLFR